METIRSQSQLKNLDYLVSLIRKEYSHKPTQEIVKKYAKRYGEEPSLRIIRRLAYKLGVNKTKEARSQIARKASGASLKDAELLRTHYPSMGAAAFQKKYARHRSLPSIIKQASKMGVRVDPEVRRRILSEANVAYHQRHQKKTKKAGVRVGKQVANIGNLFLRMPTPSQIVDNNPEE